MLKVISTGNIYLDINVTGIHESHLIPEIEYPTSKYITTLGGSAVIAPKILQKFGFSPSFLGVVGNDMFGKIVSSLLKDAGIQSNLQIEPSAQTNVGINISNKDNKTFMFVLGNANSYLNNNHLAKIESEYDILYLGGILKLSHLKEGFIGLAKRFYTSNKLVFLDHGRMPKSLSKEDAQEIILNLLPYTNIYAPSEEDVENVWNSHSQLIELVKKYPKLIIHLKQGEKGSELITANDSVNIPTVKITSKELNLVGAGDSSNAGFIKEYLSSKDVYKAAKYANLVASKHIQKIEL